MKNLIFEGFKVVSGLSAIVVVSSALSTAVSGAVLFSAAPFVPDSTEVILKDWVGRSFRVLGFSTGASIVAGIGGLCLLKSEDDLFQSPQTTQMQTITIDFDLLFGKEFKCELCNNCKFLNPDPLTRSLLHCAVCPDIPQDNFCGNFEPKE